MAQASCYPFDKKYSVTSSFTAHQKRIPPASMPGVDFGTPMNQPVYAVWAGYCKQENTADMGGAVTASITRNQPGEAGDKIYFVHLTQVVAKNRAVVAGELIGYTGNTGKSTGPHTHVSWRPWWDRKIYYDPQPILDNLPMRGEQQPQPPSSNLPEKVAELEAAKAKLLEEIAEQKQQSVLALAEKQRELEAAQAQTQELDQVIEQYTDKDQQALLINQVSMDTAKTLGEKTVDGGKYVAQSAAIGGLLAFLIARATGATGEEIALIAPGTVALVNIALIVLNHYLKIF